MKIEDLRVSSVREKNVRGLDVAVNQSMTMSFVERIGNLLSDQHRVADARRARA
jgi:hypothetical protein